MAFRIGVSQVKQQKIQKELEKRKAIINAATMQILEYGNEFSADIAKIIEGLGEYSSNNEDAFYSAIEGAVATFQTDMKTVNEAALKSYFKFLLKTLIY